MSSNKQAWVRFPRLQVPAVFSRLQKFFLYYPVLAAVAAGLVLSALSVRPVSAASVNLQWRDSKTIEVSGDVLKATYLASGSTGSDGRWVGTVDVTHTDGCLIGLTIRVSEGSQATITPGNPSNASSACAGNPHQGLPYNQSQVFSVSNTAARDDTPSVPVNDIGDADKFEDQCRIGGSLSWILCPLSWSVLQAVHAFESQVFNLLNVPTEDIFNDGVEGSPARAYHAAWNSFRYIALGLIVIAALLMVIAQAADIQILDAYTIRKVLPRFLIAAILITLSWSFLELVIKLSNDIGFGIKDLIYSPFSKFTFTISAGDTIASIVVGALLVAGSVGPVSVGLLPTLALTYGLTALLAVLLALLVLVGRKLIIIILVITAPIAFASYILPNTQKIWQVWKGALLSVLVVFPIISGMVAAGRVLAAVTLMANATWIDTIIAFIAYVLPYFLITTAFRLAGGVISTVTGIAEGKQKGWFDQLANMRKREQDYVQKRTMAGQNNPFGSERLGNLYRRFNTPGGLDVISKGGHDRYDAIDKRRRQAAVDEAEKYDNYLAASDDVATEEGVFAKDRNDYINRYVTRVLAEDKEKQRRNPKKDYVAKTEAQARAQALTALGRMESAYGDVGTANFKQGAFSAAAHSVTGFKGLGQTPEDYDEGFRRLRAAGGEMVKNGLLSDAGAAATIKSNKLRGDQSSVSFGAWMNSLNEAARGIELSKDNLDKLRQSAIENIHPGQLIGARDETIMALTPKIINNVNNAVTKRNEAIKAGNAEAIAQADADVADNAAFVSGVYNMLQQTNTTNARLFAKVMEAPTKVATTAQSQLIDPKTGQPMTKQVVEQATTIRNLIETERAKPADAQGRQRFLERSREIANTGLQYQAAQAAIQNQQIIQGGGIPPTAPPTTPFTLGS